jgi:hypothetical protein
MGGKLDAAKLDAACSAVDALSSRVDAAEIKRAGKRVDARVRGDASGPDPNRIAEKACHLLGIEWEQNHPSVDKCFDRAVAAIKANPKASEQELVRKAAGR